MWGRDGKRTGISLADLMALLSSQKKKNQMLLQNDTLLCTWIGLKELLGLSQYSLNCCTSYVRFLLASIEERK